MATVTAEFSSRSANSFRVVAVVVSALMVIISTQAVVPNYRFTAPAILIAMVWTLYRFRRLLNLHPLGYAFSLSALLLHMCGAFGYYQRSPFPFSYDILVHYYFALVFTYALYRALEANYPALSLWQRTILVFYFMMGMAALHEIMEYGTYLILGEERGMLKPSTSYFFDTQRDLSNNLLGTLTSLFFLTIHRKGVAH